MSATKNWKWVVIVYGIADRKLHSVHMRDGDVGLNAVKPGPGEATVRVPRSRYQTLTSDRLIELLP